MTNLMTRINDHGLDVAVLYGRIAPWAGQSGIRLRAAEAFWNFRINAIIGS